VSLLVSVDKEGTRPVVSPVVGKSYWVTCVQVQGWGRKNDTSVYLPVLGGRHEDKEIIGFPTEHFHYDWRFAPQWHFNANHGAGRVLLASCVKAEVRKHLRCKRAEQRYPSLKRTAISGPPWGPVLEEKFSKVRMKCLTCPHRGLPLDPASADEHGRVTCRGHGLRWELSTGELAPFNDLEKTDHESCVSAA